jgi:SAM-dependent methyltransferase|tara:strand:- start:54361 stop:55116 length:756 start_codon:yes stop_codon:yes gene_type:complete
MNKTLDTYLGLCTEVYDLSKPVPEEDEYLFYRSYAEEAGGPILEPMCGTGRFLIPLIEEGFDISGFDASEHMLERLNLKAGEKKLTPEVWHGFVEDLRKDQKYKLIFVPSGSFGLIQDLNAAKSALKTLFDHLSEDGVFVFEGETLHGVPEPLGVWRGAVWYKTDGKMIISNQLATLDGEICTSIGKYELVDSNSITHTEIETLKVRLYEPTKMFKMLKEIGFKHVNMLKTYDRTESPGENDPAIVYECRK